MRDLDIGEVAARTGLRASTLRHYEAEGLIAPSGRKGLRRQYDPAVLDRLALIALGRAAGFALTEIRAFFGPDGALDLDRDALADKADAIDETIRRLTAARDGLRHAAVCPAPRHADCPTFQRLARAAAIGLLRPADDGPAPRRPAGRPKPRR